MARALVPAAPRLISALVVGRGTRVETSLDPADTSVRATPNTGGYLRFHPVAALDDRLRLVRLAGRQTLFLSAARPQEHWAQHPRHHFRHEAELPAQLFAHNDQEMLLH